MVAVAYGSAAPQLGVAEFAPAAQQQVEAPPTTGGDQANGSSARARHATTTTAGQTASTTPTGSGASTTPTTRVGRARRCYGNPPRQTEDPMSPSCMATIFEGDNGGATTNGVSGTEIRVAVPIQYDFGAAANQQYQAVIAAIFERFNAQFELYGRRLVPIVMMGNTVDASDAPKARAAAQEIAARSVFAALAGTLELLGSYPQPALLSALASSGIVTIVHNKTAWYSDRLLFDSLHPYLWSVSPSSERLQGQLASVACTMAGGAPRDVTGVASTTVGRRKFGIMAVGQQLPPRTDLLSRAVEECTGSAPLRIEATALAGGTSTAAMRPGIDRFAAEGITTVICACERTAMFYPLSAAQSAGKVFEYLYPQSADYDGDEWAGGAMFDTVKGSSPLYAVTPGPRLELPQNSPWFSVVAGNPALIDSTGSVYSSKLAYTFRIADALYLQLLVLASGIQAAGPALTPETFAAGLQTSTFPNAEAGRPPSWLPSVGFGPGDHGFFDDFAMARWNPTMPAITPAAAYPMGSWCYIGAGERYRVDTVPADLEARLFGGGPCR